MDGPFLTTRPTQNLSRTFFFPRTRSVFTPETRASVEKLQQQYGLPVNGIWGSLERQVFDNARVRTLPPSSAAALLPPESNRLTGAASRPAAARRSYVAAAPPAPPAPPPARAGGPSALGVPVPTDVTGIVGCAAAGFLTAAVVTRADAERRRALAYASRAPPSREPPSRRAAGRRTASPIAAAFDAVAGAVASAFRGSERADFDARGSYDGGEDEQQQQYGFYDERGYFHQAPPPRRGANAGGPGSGSGSGSRRGESDARWFSDDGGLGSARADADRELDLVGGYPFASAAKASAGFGGDAAGDAFAPRGPVRPGDRAKMQRREMTSDFVPPPPPPPSTPPPPGVVRGPARSRDNRRRDDVDVMGIGRDGNAETRGGSGGGFGFGFGFGAGSGSGSGGDGGFHSTSRPESRTSATVPPYGDWGGDGGGFHSRARAGPAAVPEFGGADSTRAFEASAGARAARSAPSLSPSGFGAQSGAAQAARAPSPASATATLAPPKPMPPSQRRREEAKAAAKKAGFLNAIGDGLRRVAGAPDGFPGGGDSAQSEFSARAQRERELLAQVTEAQEYARLEQKKRQQLEAAYQSTRNALKEAQSAREGLRAQEQLSTEMKSKMSALEKALNDRDVAAASGVFGGASASGGGANPADVTALTTRVAALETALATASANSAGPGDVAAVAAMTHLQEKVKELEKAFAQRNTTADAAAAAVSKVDQLAAQVQKDAAAVPELQKQMAELRETIAKTPGAAAAGGTMAVEANLREMTERMTRLEASLAQLHESPASLDVLYAKVGAVEEGLAATANGSANLIQELQEKVSKLEGGGATGVAPGWNNVVTAVPAPAKKAEPKREPKPPPGFNPPVAPKEAETKKQAETKLPPPFTPAIDLGGKAAPAPATPPGWNNIVEAPARQAQVDTKKLGDDYKVEEGTLPRIATGREVMLQGFNWESHKFDWYSLVGERAGEIAETGFTQIWLPPCTDSLAPEGYLPRNLRSLTSKYGDEAGLRGLIGTLREKNVLPVLDAVLNHRCATHQGAGGKWNTWKDCGGMDWGEWAITNRNPDFAGQGGDPTGDEFHGAPNIDHRNQRVQESICEWINWLTHDVGFGGIRFDFSKGYGGEFAGMYTRACMPEFAVGEYWDTLNYGQGLEYDQDAHRQRIVDWIDSTGGICTAFDFTTKGILQEACARNEFWRLVDKKGRAPGVIGLWPGRAVTFIDNHDTGSTQSHWPFASNKVGMGYAYILTHPGTPSVFWDHYFDWGDDLKNQIKALLRARDDGGIHARSKLEIVAATDQVYAALVGENLAVKLGNDGWSPSGGGWNVAASGNEWCVWIKQ